MSEISLILVLQNKNKQNSDIQFTLTPVNQFV
jgi:hypothetical protein